MNFKGFALALALAALLSGCSGLPWFNQKTQEAHMVPYHGNSVNCLVLGRHYQAEGRFELARETFTNGLATAKDKEMRRILAEEIEATDRMILSQR